MANFTPGPWARHGGTTVVASNGAYIANVWEDDLDHEGDPVAEAEANAHLIAAAPDLLDACRQLTEFAKRQGWFHVAIEAGETAIAKAEGKEQ